MAINFFNKLGKLGKKKHPKADANAAPVAPKVVTVPVDTNTPTPKNSNPAQVLAEGMINVRDIIAPSAIEIDFNHLRIGNNYYRTLFISGYPRFVGANWLSPIINFDHSLDISMFYYPVKSKVILDDLRRKITELEATIMTTREKGRVIDPVVTAALEDANALQEQLVKGVEKYFKFSFYITVPAATIDELETVTSRLESTLGSLLLISKVSSLQMDDAFQSTLPTGLDKLLITRNMDTTSLATTFPFTSSDLTMAEGIMYGINKHNGSLIIFDRFSMENANTVVFATSGSGKSFLVKLEALRLMVFGAEVLIIDPEEEYRSLCETVGGNYIDFSSNSTHKINPFDLSGIVTEGENELGTKLISLITLFKLMLNGLSQTEEAILDRALMETYRLKGITSDPETQLTKEPPVMEDLYKVLLGGDEPEARKLAERLERFIKGSMAGIFDSQSNINLGSNMTVFSTKNLEEALRPIAFYLILDFVWTKIRRDLKKRVLIVEEAWYLMQNEDSARFIYGIAKRARKYYLGLTTISQDVDDFLNSEYGRAIVTNSAIQVLLKQHSAAIDKVADTFHLSEGEKRLLLAAGVGEGLFFAGSNHVAMKVMASDSEYKLITTNPEELLKLREQGILKPKQATKQTYKPYVAPADPSKYQTFDASGNAKPEFAAKLSTNQGQSPVVPQQPVRPNPQAPQPPRPKIIEPITPEPAKPTETPKPTEAPRPNIITPKESVESKQQEPKREPTTEDIIKSVQEQAMAQRQVQVGQSQQMPVRPQPTSPQPQNNQPSQPVVPPQQPNVAPQQPVVNQQPPRPAN